jgi:hypothetical protein
MKLDSNRQEFTMEYCLIDVMPSISTHYELQAKVLQRIPLIIKTIPNVNHHQIQYHFAIIWNLEDI